MTTMKKLILLALTAFMMMGCENSTSTSKVNNKANKTPNKYEVLLLTKDTIYVEADSYYLYHGYFGTNSEPDCIFIDKYYHKIQTIHNPIYVKEIKTK